MENDEKKGFLLPYYSVRSVANKYVLTQINVQYTYIECDMPGIIK